MKLFNDIWLIFVIWNKKKNQNNNIVVGKIEVLNNNMPEGILENMLKRLELLEKILQQNK